LPTSACTDCGNGIIDPGEVCDGTNLNGHTCMTQGFAGGALACTPMCALDTTGCNAGACDPDGTYTIMGNPISYTCCSGNVDVNINEFIFANAGATVDSATSDPKTMTGMATTCPSGSFSVTASINGGCIETYSLSGSFTSAKVWTGTYKITFSGDPNQCSCFGGALGTPCINQSYPITATRP
jgi:hypothetical protein